MKANFTLLLLMLVFLFGCATQRNNDTEQSNNRETSNLAEKEQNSTTQDAPKEGKNIDASGQESPNNAEPGMNDQGNQQEAEKEDPLQRKADFRLRQKINQEEVANEQSKILAESFIATARNQARQGKYAEAYADILEALNLDRTNEEALKLKNVYGRKIGYRPDEVAEQTNEAIDYIRVRIEQSKVAINNKITEGKRLAGEKKYPQAIELFKQARELLRLMPYQVEDLKGQSSQLDFLIQNTQKEYEDYQQELKNIQAAEAEAEAKRQEQARLKTQKEQVSVLFRKANLAFEREQFNLALLLCEKIKSIDPDNAEVADLIRIVKEANFARQEEETHKRYMNKWREVFLEVDKKFIYQDTIVEFPSREVWESFEKRSQSRSKVETVEGSPQERKLKEKLRDSISMDFTDSPLSEVVDFIRNRTGINIIIDPAVYKNDTEALKVNIAVNDLKLESLLNIILDMSDLKYDIKNGVLVITTKDRVKEEVILELYNVRDLTGSLIDFPGKTFTLDAPTGDAGLSGVAIVEEEEKPATSITEEQLTKIIKDNIAKKSWEEDGQRFSIDARNGTLIIRQTRKVHEQIKALLDDLRRATGLLVSIEAKFIRVTDNFLEEVGVDWRSAGAIAPGDAPEDANFNPNNEARVDPGTPINSSFSDDNLITNLPFRELDDALIGQEQGISNNGRAGGYYWRYRDDFETRERVENIFDEALGNTGFSNRGGLGLQVSYIDDIELNTILRAVSKSERTNIVTAPRLTVFNTQRANISILTQQPYIRDFEVEISTDIAVADPIIGTLQDGEVLDVRPIISSDRKYITLELQATFADIISAEGFERAVGAGTVTIQLPEIELTRIKTTVTVPDGGTILLGGQVMGQKEYRRSGIPVLSDLPIINFFVTREGNFSSRQSLIILVNARITSMEENEPNSGLDKQIQDELR